MSKFLGALAILAGSFLFGPEAVATDEPVLSFAAATGLTESQSLSSTPLQPGESRLIDRERSKTKGNFDNKSTGQIFGPLATDVYGFGFTMNPRHLFGTKIHPVSSVFILDRPYRELRLVFSLNRRDYCPKVPPVRMIYTVNLDGTPYSFPTGVPGGTREVRIASNGPDQGFTIPLKNSSGAAIKEIEIIGEFFEEERCADGVVNNPVLVR